MKIEKKKQSKIIGIIEKKRGEEGRSYKERRKIDYERERDKEEGQKKQRT